MDAPLDYLIDWYRRSDDGQRYALLDDELRGRRGPALNEPILNLPKNRWGWTKNKARDRMESTVYTSPHKLVEMLAAIAYRVGLFEVWIMEKV